LNTITIVDLHGFIRCFNSYVCNEIKAFAIRYVCTYVHSLCTQLFTILYLDSINRCNTNYYSNILMVYVEWIVILWSVNCSVWVHVTGSGKIDHVRMSKIGIPFIKQLYSYTCVLSRHHNRIAIDSQVCFSRWLFHDPVELWKDRGNVWLALIRWHWWPGHIRALVVCKCFNYHLVWDHCTYTNTLIAVHRHKLSVYEIVNFMH